MNLFQTHASVRSCPLPPSVSSRSARLFAGLPLLLCLFLSTAGHAQQLQGELPEQSLQNGPDTASVERNNEAERKEPPDDNVETDAGTSPDPLPTSVSATLERLAYIQQVLDQKLVERSELGEALELANEQDQADLREQADFLNNDIQQLRKTLESLATDGADNTQFLEQEPQSETDWREDITLIAKPVIDSLKELTEKPRRLNELNESIAGFQRESETANQALNALSPLVEAVSDGELKQTLERLQRLWLGRRNDAQNNIGIARIQIAELRGEQSLVQTFIESVSGFLTGRGLTLLLAVLAASIVWFGLRFLLKGYRTTLMNKAAPESRTRYRLVAYSMQALTFLLILVTVFVVFYQRGDVLLLGLLILLVVGLALGIRNLLPSYLTEARLLLNIGPMRENERIMYRGLPWRVESINMFTILRNPELHGVLRIPLPEFHQTTSRPCGKDLWFPSSRGDIIELEGHGILEVVDQNPDTIELRQLGGQVVSIPSATYYQAGIVNLTRGESFSVTGNFGIDYRHIDISTDRVPKLLRESVSDALANSDLRDFVRDVIVDLSLANESSIDYLVIVSCDRRAARSYFRITRLIQRACIDVCNREGLEIPFPQLSLSQRPT